MLSLLLVVTVALLSFLMSACVPSEAITAEQRTFLDISLKYLGEYQLPKMEFKDTKVGGLSGLSYDKQRDRFYAISDDRSQLAPARFYTLKLILNQTNTGEITIDKVEIEDVTLITNEQGKTFVPGSIDPEGIALSAQGNVFISSEGSTKQGIAPFIREFDLNTGKQLQSLPIPERYLANDASDEEQSPRGIQNNLGFESLTLEPLSLAAAKGDPFRLFTATESALFQDTLPPPSEEELPQPARIRMMQYLIGEATPTLLVSENVYLLDIAPSGTIANGLTDLITLGNAGHFLSLERTYGLGGNSAKIYQLATGSATDTSGIFTLKGDISRIEPIQKKLLLDLSELGIYLDNLEGIELGPRLSDGTQSLLLVSDDNFREEQVTQFLLFKLES
ncbi:MAG: esterase-like activity of phytase family protein [Symploca sp. SIO1C4]|uniref:Esterase-like activity of phytase family protein n=1 Tax=Symploca sp. SIO1C4 TaxID=2607765 RepID=A0A6B3NLE7_9CYAN|nr:esterase-like activity of phytase family protein [Symploca sp. SIO1C4]